MTRRTGYRGMRWAVYAALLVLIAVVVYFAAVISQVAFQSRSIDGRLESFVQPERPDEPALQVQPDQDVLRSHPDEFISRDFSIDRTDDPTNAAPARVKELASDAEQPDEAFDEIENAIEEQAKPAEAVIEVDTKMQMGRDYTASLIVEGGDGSNIEALITSTKEPVAQRMDIEIASSAAAYVTSSAFDVEPMSPREQSIRTRAPTIWRWRLTPKRAGEADLMFTLMQRVLIDGREHTFPVRQFPHVVRVELSWWLWVRDLSLSFWGMLTALLLAGASIATILRTWQDMRKGRRSSPVDPSPRG